MAATNETKYGDLTNSGGNSIPETVRSSDEFPTGTQCKVCRSDIPDDEMGFGWTQHYKDRKNGRQNPDVTSEIVEQLLTEGIVRQSDAMEDRYLVQKEIDDIEWTLVIAEYPKEEAVYDWVLITVFSNYHGSIGLTNKYLDRRRERKQGDSA